MSEVLSTAGAPWQRAYIERVIGTIRRECPGTVIAPADQRQAISIGTLATEIHDQTRAVLK